jgi:hypothetical protein
MFVQPREPKLRFSRRYFEPFGLRPQPVKPRRQTAAVAVDANPPSHNHKTFGSVNSGLVPI